MYHIQAFSFLTLAFICGSYGYVDSDNKDKEDIEQNVRTLLDLETGLFGQEAAISSPSSLKEITENLNDTDVKEMSSSVVRYVGIGYDLITGCPEGDFDRGVVDPGLKLTRRILKFTYDEGKTDEYFGSTINIPDQVNFAPSSSCGERESSSVYAGSKSYQDSLHASIDAEASGGFYSFSASAAMSRATKSTEESKRVNIDHKTVCNYGDVRYKGTGVITDDFYRSVNALPSTYSASIYNDFIREWGTHLVTEVNVGTRRIHRFSSTYEQAYTFEQTSSAVSLGVGYVGVVVSGSVKVSLDVLNQESSFSDSFGQTVTTFTMGSEAIPVPIYTKLKPIYHALDRKYWGSQYDSLQISQKRISLLTSFKAQSTLRGKALLDPDISIPLKWPEGKYSFPEGVPGCPTGFIHGCRFQDTEDDGNKDILSGEWRLYGDRRLNGGIEICYCTRTQSVASIFTWPKGRYCIARKGDRCPGGFNIGSIFWDDENSGNGNKVKGILPDGTYGANTLIHYCCRNDGKSSDAMTLPNTENFILYQFSYPGCQAVNGMISDEVTVKYDCEDSGTSSKCTGTSPYDDDCGDDHKIFMCFYRKKHIWRDWDW